MDNYVIFHLHTMLSNPITNIDSVNNYKEYVDRAKELNMKAIAFSEHGNIFNWFYNKKYTEENGLKYIHAVEVYVTNSFKKKERDNYHVILIAKNYAGFKELNTLVINLSIDQIQKLLMRLRDFITNQEYRLMN